MVTATLWAEFVFRVLCGLRLFRAAATWARFTGLVWIRCQILEGRRYG